MDNKRKRTIQLICFMIAFFTIWTLRVTFTYGIDESITSPLFRAIFSNSLRFLIWVVPAATYVYILRNASPIKYLGLSVWPDRKNWSVCIITISIYLLAVVLFKVTIDKKSFSADFLSTIPVTIWLIQLLIPPLIEDILFRGFLVTELRAIMPLSHAFFLGGFLFACIHVPFWVTSGAKAYTILVSGCHTTVFGILTCWLFAKTKSIWPSTFAHIAANLLPQFFI